MTFHLRCVSKGLGALVFCLAAASCRQSSSDYPPGYLDECFGGIEHQARNWVCSDDRLRLITSGEEGEWATFAQMVANVGRSQGLHVIHTDLFSSRQGRAVQVSVCNADGLYLSFDTHSLIGGQANPDANVLRTTLRTYRNDFKWRPLADALIAEVEKSWRHPIEKEWPEPRGSDRARPDSVSNCDEPERPNKSLERSRER
jgi:hypothetical protein